MSRPPDCQAAQAALGPFEGAREAHYRAADPEGLARSLPGIARVRGPVTVAFTGEASRFRSGDRYASFVGLVPASSETGDSDRKGRSMTKAGNGRLRRAFWRAADTARKEDPQLAAIYWTQMVERGANHTKALSVVAAALARRFRATMVRGTPYEIRDTDGRPVTREEARAIIAARYTVPDEVRGPPSQQEGGEARPSPRPRRTCLSKPSWGESEATRLRRDHRGEPRGGGQPSILKTP